MTGIGYCPKCHHIKQLSIHHVFPRRFFGENDSKLRICRECHSELERLIPVKYKLTKDEYLLLTQSWLSI